MKEEDIAFDLDLGLGDLNSAREFLFIELLEAVLFVRTSRLYCWYRALARASTHRTVSTTDVSAQARVFKTRSSEQSP